MDRIAFWPLGSIVTVKGGVKKIMIVARGCGVEFQGKTSVFDYAGCLYPEGLLGDQVMYFNHADIAKLIFEGFSDEDNDMMLETINEWLEKTELIRGNPAELNDQSEGAEG